MTPKERDELLIRMDERLKGQDTVLLNIQKQVTKTNGRVTELEDKRIPELEHWQSRNKGRNQVLVAISSGVGIILGIIATIIAGQ